MVIVILMNIAKSDNELIWFSEQCFNIDDKNEYGFVSRLIIKYVNK